jgi:hypothetical protein
MKGPKEQEVRKSEPRVEEYPKSREELVKHYNIESILGLNLLIRDADDLESNEKAVLGQLAIAVGGPLFNGDPAMTCIGHQSIADGAAISISHVKRGYEGLERKGIVVERKKVNFTRWDTRVDWLKLRKHSYRWRDMLAREAAGVGSDQNPAETTKPLGKNPELLSEIDEDLSGLDLDAPRVQDTEHAMELTQDSTEIEADEEEVADAGDAPSEETSDHETIAVLHRDAVFIDTLLPSAFWRGIAFTHGYTLGEGAQRVLIQKASYWGFEVKQDVEGIRIALPLHEYAALRLTQASGKQVESSYCTKLVNKQGDDHYAVIEYGLATESWATLIREGRSPIAVLMHCFDDIRESWLTNGGYTCEPPLDEIIDAMFAMDFPIDPQDAREEMMAYVADEQEELADLIDEGDDYRDIYYLEDTSSPEERAERAEELARFAEIERERYAREDEAMHDETAA